MSCNNDFKHKNTIVKPVLRGHLWDKELETQWAEPVSLTFHSALRKLNTEPPIGAFHQVLVIWLSSYREEDIQKSTNQKQEWPVVAMFKGLELNEQYYKGPSKDASYQVSIHLAMQFQRKQFFRNQPIRNKNCLWRPCLLTDRN